MDLALEGRDEGDPLCKMSIRQGLRADQHKAEPQYQLPTHKGSSLSLASSAKSKDLLQWNCPCPQDKIEIPLDMDKGSPPLHIWNPLETGRGSPVVYILNF